jgi:hypothetical protein
VDIDLVERAPFLEARCQTALDSSMYCWRYRWRSIV